MPRYAAEERQALANTLIDVGPDAPTLCAGWASRDLVAHLVLRERHPLPAAGIVLPPLAGVTERAQRRLAEGDFVTLVETIRRPAGWSPIRFGAVDEAVNLVEFFVHHEDLLRAQPGWQARQIDPGYAGALWHRVPLLARMRLARFPATATVTAPGHGAVSAGRGPATATLSGHPGELVLALFGRHSVAQVAADGPEDLVRRLLRG